jgi:hypothetical protein
VNTPKLKQAALAGVFVAGCAILKQVGSETSQIALDHLDQAIATLGQQSSGWQATLTNLEQQLTSDAQTTLANEVTQLAQKGIATGGTEIRCDADFIGTRMKQDLERIAARLRHRQVPPVQPALCQVVPTFVDMNHLPGQLEYYGYDLNAPDGIQMVLLYDGGEVPLNTWTALPTHYLMTLDVTAAPLCNRENRRIALRYDGAPFSTVNVTKRQCPRAPEPPPPAPSRILAEAIADLGGGVSGVSEDRVYGSQCSVGYVREQCRVQRLQGTGSCYAEGTNPRDASVRLGWTTDDTHNGECRVHYGIPPFQGVSCKVQIFEVGEQQPRQPDPPCPCW